MELEKMALKALVAPLEDLGIIPSTHVVHRWFTDDLQPSVTPVLQY